MKNSNLKGKVGEREAVKYLTSLGYTARRSQQHNGIGLGDVVVEELPHVHFEIKRNEEIGLGTRLLEMAIEQAVHDANGLWPVVLWRRNRQPWRLTSVFQVGGFRHWATTTNVAIYLSLLRKD